MKRSDLLKKSAYTLIEMLISASLFAVGIFVMATLLRWTTNTAIEIQDGTVFQKDLDGIFRQEFDFASQWIVTSDVSSTNLVSSGTRVRWLDNQMHSTDLYFQDGALYIKREGQSAFALVSGGISNGRFDASSGGLDVRFDSDRGNFQSRYEWKKIY